MLSTRLFRNSCKRVFELFGPSKNLCTRAQFLWTGLDFISYYFERFNFGQLMLFIKRLPHTILQHKKSTKQINSLESNGLQRMN